MSVFIDVMDMITNVTLTLQDIRKNNNNTKLFLQDQEDMFKQNISSNIQSMLELYTVGALSAVQEIINKKVTLNA